MRIRNILKRKISLKPDRQTMEHHGVLEFFRHIFGLDQPVVATRNKALGDFEAASHQPEEALVAGALPLMTQNL